MLLYLKEVIFVLIFAFDLVLINLYRCSFFPFGYYSAVILITHLIKTQIWI